MVQRMWAEAAGPIGGTEPLFPGSRRSRSVWDAVRLEPNVLCSIVCGWGVPSSEVPLLYQPWGSQLGITASSTPSAVGGESELNSRAPSIHPSTCSHSSQV